MVDLKTGWKIQPHWIKMLSKNSDLLSCRWPSYTKWNSSFSCSALPQNKNWFPRVQWCHCLLKNSDLMYIAEIMIWKRRKKSMKISKKVRSHTNKPSDISIDWNIVRYFVTNFVFRNFFFIIDYICTMECCSIASIYWSKQSHLYNTKQ